MDIRFETTSRFETRPEIEEDAQYITLSIVGFGCDGIKCLPGLRYGVLVSGFGIRMLGQYVIGTGYKDDLDWMENDAHSRDLLSYRWRFNETAELYFERRERKGFGDYWFKDEEAQ